jgi:hypothetical protein
VKRVLENAMGRQVDLVLTNNRATIISFSKSKEGVSLRVQRIFAEAPHDVILEIAEYVKKPSIKTPLIYEFFRRNQWRIRKLPRNSRRIEPVGRVYNLQKIFEKLNREYFSNEINAMVTWGACYRKKSVRMRTLGSYNEETKMIRIHPMLDSLQVPRFFVEFVLYHEMLHASLGIRRRTNGRMGIHTKEFKVMERKYRHYDDAVAWEKSWGRGISR